MTPSSRGGVHGRDLRLRVVGRRVQVDRAGVLRATGPAVERAPQHAEIGRLDHFDHQPAFTAPQPSLHNPASCLVRLGLLRIHEYDAAIAAAQKLAGPEFMQLFDLDRETADLRNQFGGEFGQRRE